MSCNQLTLSLSLLVFVFFNPSSGFPQDDALVGSDRLVNKGRSACEPVWADESSLRFDGEVLVLLTHFTDRLDKFKATRPALCRLTRLAQEHDWPMVYLHEATAPNEKYFYCDCNPAAYVKSSLGEFHFDTSKQSHIILAGGYYELCMNNTFQQVIENWRRLQGATERRISLVLDATYGVASDSRFSDPFDANLQAWIRTQPDRTILMSSALAHIPNRTDAWTFLSRRWQPISNELGLHVRYKNELTAIRFAATERPTVVLHYTTSTSLAASVDPETSLPLPVELAKFEQTNFE